MERSDSAAFLQLRAGNFDDTDLVGTVHDMRFVFLDNDTKLLFATAYDDAWDPYIDDFAAKIPNQMDLFFCNCVGWPGIHSPSVKDWIAKYQVAADGWYVANPDLTVVETRLTEARRPGAGRIPGQDQRLTQLPGQPVRRGHTSAARLSRPVGGLVQVSRSAHGRRRAAMRQADQQRSDREDR